MSDNKSPEMIRAEFAEALSQRYLTYALSTITSRSLPDVRDGLKPVHRRLLYAMRQLKLDPGRVTRNRRVLSAMSWVSSTPMVMQRSMKPWCVWHRILPCAIRWSTAGNFGNIDGDSAAAMRYTEARMSDVARMLLEGIDEDAVDFRGTYDGESEEPVILPAAFPNLLANGAQGIAVGMATSIPPHNIIELCRCDPASDQAPQCQR